MVEEYQLPNITATKKIPGLIQKGGNQIKELRKSLVDACLFKKFKSFNRIVQSESSQSVID